MLVFSMAWPKSIGASDLTVAADVVNLRQGPGLSYPIIDQLKNGDNLTTIETSGDWVHVKSGNVEGWVASWLTTATGQADRSAQVIISQVDHLNVRAQPSVSASVLVQLFTGNEAHYIKSEGDWIQIKYGNVSGWVAAEYVSIKDVASSTSEATPTTSLNGTTFTVNVDAVNIRKKADLNSKKLGVAYRNEQFKVIGQTNNWVQIQYTKDTTAWVYSFYGSFSGQEATANSTSTGSDSITIIYDGTNMRSEASTSADVLYRANAGESFPIIATEDDWYEVSVNGQRAFVANWVVSTNSTKATAATKSVSTDRKKGTLKGLTIVVDAGHGGNDHGTTGVRGTDEKGITLKTAELLTSKLRAAGAEVIMTRESDTYIDLRKRVAVAHQANADAFISIHYDATTDSSVSGITTYYTNSYQKSLAEYVHAGLAKKVDIRNRGVQPGNYLVLRENRQPAVLLELGFLSNASEERNVTTNYYREQATLGIYNGLLQYFDAQL